MTPMEELNFEAPEISYEKFMEKLNLENSFYDAKELIEPIKEKLLENYSMEEIVDRMILNVMGIDNQFKLKNFAEEAHYFIINPFNRDKDVTPSKELNIPSKYILSERTNKCLISLEKNEIESFKEKYLNEDFYLSK